MAQQHPSARLVRKWWREATSVQLTWQARVASWSEQLLYLVVIGGVAVELAASGLSRRERTTEQWSTGSAEWSLAWLSLIAVLTLLKVLLAFGPVFAGKDHLFWILSSPVGRGSLLLYRFVAVVVLGAVTGAAWSLAIVSILSSTTELSAVPFVCSAAVGAVAASCAVIVQRAPLRTPLVQCWLSTSIAVSIGALLAGVLIPSVAPATSRAFHIVPPEMAVLGSALIASVATLGAARSLNALGRGALSPGSELASVTAVSVSWFDFNLIGAILAERRARLIGRVRSVRLRGHRMIALVWADFLRITRSRNALTVWAASIAVPIVVGRSTTTGLVPAIHLIAAFVATDRLAGGLRFVFRSSAIRRMLGMSTRTLLLAHLAMPAAAAIIWCTITVPLTPGVSFANGALSAIGALAVVYRIATKPPLDYGNSLIDFGVFGPTPIGLAVQLGRGPILLILLGAVQLTVL